MKLRLKSHILLQRHSNGEISLLDIQNAGKHYWVASGLAAEALLLIREGISKEELLETLARSYNGTHTEIEKRLNRLLSSLTQQGMLTKTKAKAFGLKDLLFRTQKSPSKVKSQKLQKKRKIVSSFKKEALTENSFLVAYATGQPCVIDTDCPPGELCSISADMCTQFCYASS
jgi:polyhydroxyalkanoate synthesis regulator phasin